MMLPRGKICKTPDKTECCTRVGLGVTLPARSACDHLRLVSAVLLPRGNGGLKMRTMEGM